MMSVIIPTLNEAKLLPQLLGQFTPRIRKQFDLEIIISDGGSTDETCNIAQSFGCGLVVHHGADKQTIAGGRNAGAAVAQGDILVFLNADVLLSDADTFFTQIQNFLGRPGLVALTASVHIFPEEETVPDRLFHTVHNGYVRFLNFIGEGMGRGECQIMTRTMFEKVGGNNAGLAAGEDYDLFRRLRKHGKIRMLTKVVVFESPRRFRKFGYVAIVWDWTKNAIAVMLKNKSASKDWEAVR
jgi:glycosyltransferase involved in cell wall biosynthesis